MIKVLNYFGYGASDLTKEIAAMKLVNQALVSQSFYQLWKQQKCTETQGMTQEQILLKLRQDDSIEFQMYDRFWSRVIGYFSGGDLIWVNRKYFTSASVIDRASNNIHEFSHKCGFTHNQVWDTSVPYTLGRVIEQWANATQAPDTPSASSQTLETTAVKS